MTTCLGKSCSFGLPRVPSVNCCQFNMFLVLSLLVLRAGNGMWLYQFLIIAYLFTLFLLIVMEDQCLYSWWMIVIWTCHHQTVLILIQLSHVTRKPVFGIFDQVRLKPACWATETSQSLEIANVETRDIILSRHRTTKALIRLRGCAGWSAPLLFAYVIRKFSHDVAQLVILNNDCAYCLQPTSLYSELATACRLTDKRWCFCTYVVCFSERFIRFVYDNLMVVCLGKYCPLAFPLTVYRKKKRGLPTCPLNSFKTQQYWQKITKRTKKIYPDVDQKLSPVERSRNLGSKQTCILKCKWC